MRLLPSLPVRCADGEDTSCPGGRGCFGNTGCYHDDDLVPTVTPVQRPTLGPTTLARCCTAIPAIAGTA